MTEDRILRDLSEVIARGPTVSPSLAASPSSADGSAASPAASPEGSRPVIVISYAQSLDGCLTRRQGKPYPLSGDAAMRVTHGVRSACDGLLAGIGTVLADDPRLTTRMGFTGDPLPIILDSRLRFPLSARLLSNPIKPLIATLSSCADEHSSAAVAQASAADSLRTAGANVWSFAPDSQGRIPLGHLLSTLARERQIRSIMVEGGARVIAAFLDAGLCDYLVVTIAPIFLANRNAVSLALNGHAPMPTLTELNHAKLGKDLIVWGAPTFA